MNIQYLLNYIKNRFFLRIKNIINKLLETTYHYIENQPVKDVNFEYLMMNLKKLIYFADLSIKYSV